MYCPARWIGPKLGSFGRSSLKREAQKVFRQIRPPPIFRKPFKVLERLLVFYLPFQLYKNLDSCGEYSLRTWIKFFVFIPQFTMVNVSMTLSKLQTLNPSAIDKCTMVFVPPLVIKKKLRHFFNAIAQFTNVRSIRSGFYQ
jgi:hypothetical protein